MDPINQSLKEINDESTTDKNDNLLNIRNINTFIGLIELIKENEKSLSLHTIPIPFLKIKKLFLIAVERNPEIVQRLDKSMYDDVEFICKLVSLNNKCFGYMPYEVRNNGEIVKHVVGDLRFTKCFKYASLVLKDDYKLCNELLNPPRPNYNSYSNELPPYDYKTGSFLMKYITNYEIKSNKKFFEDFPGMIRYAHPDLLNDKSFMKRFIEDDVYVFEFAGENIRSDIEIVKQVVKKYPVMLAFADPKLWSEFKNF